MGKMQRFGMGEGDEVSGRREQRLAGWLVWNLRVLFRILI